MNSEQTIFVGMDVSKGYADLHAINCSRSVLAKTRVDDTATGHETVRHLVREWLQQTPTTHVLVGVESSGGLERNWVSMLRTSGTRVTVITLNPLIVKRFLSQNLHRSVTDAHSAAGIARYLADGMRQYQEQNDPGEDGLREIYRCVGAANHRLTEVKNQLQGLLPRVHPDLVQFTRSGFPHWVLDVLERYPTAAALSRARVSALARIPHVTEARARTLVTAAKESVASQTDAYTGSVIIVLAREVRNQMQVIDDLKAALCAALGDDRPVHVMTTIAGIGQWTAVSLRIEIGRIERFPSAEALTAYAGLDPRIHQSGDTQRRMRISKCGSRRIRAALYMATLTAIRVNPVIAAFYERLRAAGKPTKVCLTACMRKLLHIIYACWLSDQPFDPTYEEKRRAERPVQHVRTTQQEGSVTDTAHHIVTSAAITAPVSRREAQRRKAAAVPQTRITRVMRGLGAASRRLSSEGGR